MKGPICFLLCCLYTTLTLTSIQCLPTPNLFGLAPSGFPPPFLKALPPPLAGPPGFLAPPAANHFTRALYEDDIVPSIIDYAPNSEAQVLYNANGTLMNAAFGNELQPEVVKDRPIIHWYADPHSYYTIIFIDPDAPSRKDPKHGQFLHFLVTNIPGHNVHMGNVIADYVGAYPPKDTGFHRYIILVYQQMKRVDVKEPFTPSTSFENRPKFSAKIFAEKHQLLGPVAINYFQAKNDEFVQKFWESQGVMPEAEKVDGDAEVIKDKEPESEAIQEAINSPEEKPEDGTPQATEEKPSEATPEEKLEEQTPEEKPVEQTPEEKPAEQTPEERSVEETPVEKPVEELPEVSTTVPS